MFGYVKKKDVFKMIEQEIDENMRLVAKYSIEILKCDGFSSEYYRCNARLDECTARLDVCEKIRKNIKQM